VDVNSIGVLGVKFGNIYRFLQQTLLSKYLQEV